jgi:hypothetical protein
MIKIKQFQIESIKVFQQDFNGEVKSIRKQENSVPAACCKI